MISPESKQTIETLCGDVDREAIDEFFSRMDEDYFASFPPEEISKHIRMSAGLSARQRVAFSVESRGSNEFNIVIVAFDYLSEFSILCGLLSAFGLDIHSGDVYSFAKAVGQSSPRKIVDVFTVRLRSGESFDERKQREFGEELQAQANLLAAGSVDVARERLNRFLTERIERMNQPLVDLLAPVGIHFNNERSPDWTVLEAHSTDAFAFLYAVSNALAMQGTYIHKVKIRSSDDQAIDEFFIANRWGRKIVDAREQDRLRMVVAMIKQFTGFLTEAPDPAKAMRHFDQLLDRIAEEDFPEGIMTFLSRPEGMNLLAHLLGSSDFLWDEFLRIHFAELLPLLEGFRKPDKMSLRTELQKSLEAAGGFEDKKRIVNQFKDTQVFLIDAKHLLDPQATLDDFSEALTDLAEVIIDAAAVICRENMERTPGAFTICGLGKFGGREMGYASDLELVFVHDAPGNSAFFETLARQVNDFIEARNKGIFHIDLRLRPYGEKGALCTPFEQFAKYYDVNGPAAPFERQALIKLRWVAGDEPLGRRVEAQRDRFTYSDAPWDWQNALNLRRRQMRELVKQGQINVKYSAGGIVDIEYAVQYLQILNGKHHSDIRVPNTLDAMGRLRRLQIIREPDYFVLHGAYLFLRNLIDALRIVRGDASDLVLPEENSEEFKSLARRLGYREQDRRHAAERLAADIRDSMKKVNEYFLMRFDQN